MIKPKSLKKGDTIGLLGASSSVPADRVEPAIKAMEKLGFNVVVGESCRAKHGFLAGTDEVRAKDINEMFADKNIDGIFCIRGGYGSQRLLDMLDYTVIKNNPKIFAGYSDVTALHIAFNQMCDLITYHAPMASTELYKDDLDEYTRDNFVKAIFGDNSIGKIENPNGEEMITIMGGKAEGIITGGNLCLISASIGTPYEIDTKGKIIFIEEIGEEPYKIDRMLLQMKYANKFKDCVGIIFGAFTDCEAEYPERSLTLLQIFDELIKDENKPTIFNFRCGHCLPTATIPLGARVNMDADKKEIEILE